MQHCLLQSSERIGPAYLTITPRILAAALEVEDGELLSPEDAAQDLIAAVTAAYPAIAAEPENLWALAGVSEDGAPYSVGFLSLSVLAAYQMHSDDEAGPNAYYPRLASLLGCDLVAGHPRGFDPVDFGHLWDRLSYWLQDEIDRPLALPGADAGIRKYVAYPLSHVPLRQVDIEKLPEFFDGAGFEPGSRVDSALLGEAFQRWTSARALISRAGEAALADQRRTAVEAQLSLELEAWDGSWTDRAGRKVAAVHVLLDFRRRQPYLFFLPRRPLSFPAIFDDGTHVFESGEQGWYDPVRMTAEDGSELEDGFVWVGSSSRGSVSLHRPPSKAIALRPAADATGYLSQRGLPLGVESAVLCTASFEPAAEEYLSRVTSTRCRALDHPAVPKGWRLFSRVVARVTELPPPGLDGLAVESTPTVVLRGGLRLGRRAAWLAGAPPAILIGGPDGLVATIDGHPGTVSDGVLDPKQCGGIGSHVVEAARVRKTFEIVEADGNWGSPLVNVDDEPARQSVALPSGSWTVLGARPGQVVRAASSDRGIIVSVPFPPVWAVSVGSGPGATVVCLVERPLSAMTSTSERARPGDPTANWASTIYEAHIRRPRFGWVCEPAEGVELRGVWRTYWLASRALKRRWRRIP